jgi:hypothetical protein
MQYPRQNPFARSAKLGRFELSDVEISAHLSEEEEERNLKPLSISTCEVRPRLTQRAMNIASQHNVSLASQQHGLSNTNGDHDETQKYFYYLKRHDLQYNFTAIFRAARSQSRNKHSTK